ncbi:MAG: cytochrome c oxidase subunit 3 [Armatimonadetes bacterium]|nr:cytochrome c oxidase subunit 3 [Armatimonadota bacterium]MDW8121818.1 cytochrome c oxidase subunit 3 [Armatimonadota bacterium]
MSVITEKVRGRGPDSDIGRGDDGWGDSGEWRTLPLPTAQLGLWLFLGALAMFFAAFISAYLVRLPSPDWRSFTKPPVLWFNTAVLILSSIFLHASQIQIRKDNHKTFLIWLLLGTFFGLVFLGGQWIAWLTLQRQGVYLPTNPSSSFFYVLTGAHGVHLLGGLILLTLVCLRALRGKSLHFVASTLGLTTTYWHFLTVVWLALFGVLLIG